MASSPPPPSLTSKRLESLSSKVTQPLSFPFFTRLWWTSGKRSDCIKACSGFGRVCVLYSKDARFLCFQGLQGSPSILARFLLRKKGKRNDIVGYINVFWHYRYQELHLFIHKEVQPKAVVESGSDEICFCAPDFCFELEELSRPNEMRSRSNCRLMTKSNWKDLRRNPSTINFDDFFTKQIADGCH